MRAAARLVSNGASLFLNIGTTAEMRLAGGLVRGEDGGVVGPEATAFFERFCLDTGLISISGIDPNGIPSTSITARQASRSSGRA